MTDNEQDKPKGSLLESMLGGKPQVEKSDESEAPKKSPKKESPKPTSAKVAVTRVGNRPINGNIKVRVKGTDEVYLLPAEPHTRKGKVPFQFDVAESDLTERIN